MINRAQQAVLRVLFTMASEGCPADCFILAAELGLSDSEAEAVLEQLDQAGLVDARRVRLTMCGLAVAVSLPSARRRLASCSASNQAA
jgi:Mn-dependent DtxR family transcriptional regulator